MVFNYRLVLDFSRQEQSRRLYLYIQTIKQGDVHTLAQQLFADHALTGLNSSSGVYTSRLRQWLGTGNWMLSGVVSMREVQQPPRVDWVLSWLPLSPSSDGNISSDTTVDIEDDTQTQ